MMELDNARRSDDFAGVAQMGEQNLGVEEMGNAFSGVHAVVKGCR